MSTVPQLPERISPDGSELWAWAGDFSAFIQRQARIKELTASIRTEGTRCGDCYLWMKSRECPREQPGTGKRAGYSVGPHMNSPICGKFEQTRSSSDRLQQLKQELASLTT